MRDQQNYPPAIDRDTLRPLLHGPHRRGYPKPLGEIPPLASWQLGSYPLTQYVKYLQPHRRLYRNLIANRRRRIERIGIIGL